MRAPALSAILCLWALGGLWAGEERRGIDVNETPPLALAWPFFDWVGHAEELTIINHH